MAGLFLCAWHLLGGYLGYLDSILGVNLGIHLGFHLGFHLGSLGFDLGVSTRPGSGKVFLSTSDTQIVQT